jgi:hypothetical protein
MKRPAPFRARSRSPVWIKVVATCQDRRSVLLFSVWLLFLSRFVSR